MAREVIYLVNIGTPHRLSLSAVRSYLQSFLTDPYVIQLPWFFRQMLVRGIIAPFRAKKSFRSYEKIWEKEGSPLEKEMKKIQSQLSRLLPYQEIRLVLRYHPSDFSKGFFSDVASFDRIQIIGFFPQYALSTNRSLFDKLFFSLKEEKWLPDLYVKTSLHPTWRLLDCWKDHLRVLWQPDEFDHLLFSYHGLPLSHLPQKKSCGYQRKEKSLCTKSCQRFCYAAQCEKWTLKLANSLKLQPSQFSLSYQSRLQNAWLKPFTDEWILTLRERGVKRLAVCCPSFVVDCLETLFEIQEELKEDWLKAGGERLVLFPSLNDHPAFLLHLKQIIEMGSFSMNKSVLSENQGESFYAP